MYRLPNYLLSIGLALLSYTPFSMAEEFRELWYLEEQFEKCWSGFLDQ